MMKHTIMKAAIAALAAASLLSCNKDEVIEPPTDDEATSGNYRPATSTSRAFCDRVYDWTPAPGQYVNDYSGDKETLGIKDMNEATAWALKRLDAGNFVTLGAFGGYIIVGFDHSIKSSGGDYDFAVAGNAFYNAATGRGGSNEPGIVYVMQDRNDNGLPDDEWYELRGSDSFSEETCRDYAVTYHRPAGPGSDVSWTDNRGVSGTVDYLGAFHKQDYYYPEWIEADSYTLSGICLKARNTLDEATGSWNNAPFDYGYADNMGADNFKSGNLSQCNRFRISDAVDADGQAVLLGYIDFVKIQTGVNTKSGWLGELSTEVCGIFDLNLQ